MRFTKMQGLGNDYVYVNCFEEKLPDPQKLAIEISDRHFGVGSDGLILIMPSDQADVRMRMFNSDGSEAQMCGNGIRCVAKYAYEHNLLKARPLSHPVCDRLLRSALPDTQNSYQITVQTGNGILTLALATVADKVEQICVDMGRPILAPDQIPVKLTGQQAVGVPLSIEGRNLLMTCVSMGNPHAVFYCDDVAAIDLELLGPAIENHAMFPQRVNAHFVQVISERQVIVRTWERGSGITLACGTGAASVCVAGVLASKTSTEILAHLPGGDLQLLWDRQDDHVYMVGPAVEVFSGAWK